jgi:hypothetical protein
LTDGEGGFPAFGRPLRSLDLFSGSGGLSLGLEQSGVARSAWAVESNASAAEAFGKNFPSKSGFFLHGDQRYHSPGTNVMILLLSSSKKCAFCLKLKPYLCIKIDHNIGLQLNCQKIGKQS